MKERVKSYRWKRPCRSTFWWIWKFSRRERKLHVFHRKATNRKRKIEERSLDYFNSLSNDPQTSKTKEKPVEVDTKRKFYERQNVLIKNDGIKRLLLFFH
jgi:hypothetical protein